MPSALDVAQYVLDHRGPMTTMKLQKLVYYSQAWSLVWDDNRLFPERIEAWKNGPVVRELWEATRGEYRVSQIRGGDGRRLGHEQQETVNRVIDFYGQKDAQWLSDLTHMEAPWAEAYARGQNTEIELVTMLEYYSSLMKNAQA